MKISTLFQLTAAGLLIMALSSCGYEDPHEFFTNDDNVENNEPAPDPTPPEPHALDTLVSGNEQLTVGRISTTSATVSGLNNAETYTVCVQTIGADGTAGTSIELGSQQPEADENQKLVVSSAQVL